MENSKLSHASFLEILFDGRNKAYGAYLLRLNYEHRLKVAMVIVIFGVLAFCALMLLAPSASSIDHSFLQITPVRIEPYKVPEKKKMPVYQQKAPAPSPKQAMKKLTVPHITPDKEVMPAELPPKQADKVRVGPVTRTGLHSTGALAVPPEMKGVGTGSGRGNLPGGHKEPDYESIFTNVEVEASFPGGATAWKNYLERNLRRNIATDNGAQAGRYTVIVSFIVATDGKTSSIQVEQAPSPDYGIKDEAIRVIERSGRWNPAIQNGRAVAYREKQKITFVVH